MGQQIEQLAQFVAQMQLEQIPQEVQQHAKLVVLDTLGVILAGSARPEVSQLREKLNATAGTGATVFARGWPHHDPRTAGFLNTVAGRAIELGEGHRYVSYQGAMQILPGVLAVGECAQTSGREMLAALILGYDVGARLAAAMKSRPLAHQNGQAALLGAAAAGARMRGLNAADTSRAMRSAMPPPGGKGTTTRMGLLGYSWARTGAAHHAAARVHIPIEIPRIALILRSIGRACIAKHPNESI